MFQMENPAARAGANRVLKVKAFSSSIDSQNPNEIHPEIQSEMLAVSIIARRFRCKNAGCPRVVFCERIPDVLAHARTTR